MNTDKQQQESYLVEFIKGYTEEAIWTTLILQRGEYTYITEEHVNFMVIDDETLEKMQSDCRQFVQDNMDDLIELEKSTNTTAIASGRDFLVARMTHFLGYWEFESEVGVRLANAAKLYPKVHLYISGDNKTIRTKPEDSKTLRCTAEHDPGEWPYVSRCIHNIGHIGLHTDRLGRTWNGD